MSRFGLLIGTGLIAVTALAGALTAGQSHAAPTARIVADSGTPTSSPTADPDSFMWG
jgi:hypothetical protein